jgi:hypothetical protein
MRMEHYLDSEYRDTAQILEDKPESVPPTLSNTDFTETGQGLNTGLRSKKSHDNRIL